jgi:hypothetical protein
MTKFIEINEDYLVVATHTEFPEINHNRIIPIKDNYFAGDTNQIEDLMGLVVGNAEYKPFPYLEHTIVIFE